MKIQDEFVEAIKSGLDDRIGESNFRPQVEVWPEEDDFGRWVASHEGRVKGILCQTPEFGSSPFCGRGMH